MTDPDRTAAAHPGWKPFRVTANGVDLGVVRAFEAAHAIGQVRARTPDLSGEQVTWTATPEAPPAVPEAPPAAPEAG